MIIKVKGREIEIQPAKLRIWCVLEDVMTLYHDAIEEGSRIKFCDYLIQYLSKATDTTFMYWLDVPWWETIQAFVSIGDINKPDFIIPLTDYNSERKELPWDYPGRTWFMMANFFAKRYGWTLEYIAELDVRIAFSLMQEALLDDQLDKEWEWGLSEIAYPYDKNTKQSKYKPLPRPVWMKEKIKPVTQNIRILKELIPQGNVIDLMEMYRTKGTIV